MKKFLFLVFFSLIFLIFPSSVRSVSCDSEIPSNPSESFLTEVKDDCDQRIQQARDQVSTLSREISLMDSRIKLTALKITQTEIQIKTTEQEITTLTGKIVRLDGSLDEISKFLLSRVAETYKKGKMDSVALLLSSKSFSDFISQYRFLQAVQVHDREMLLAMEQTRTSYDEQKQLKEKLQAELIKLKKQLDSDKTLLAQQKKNKESLLLETRNNEAKYQSLRARALAEIASLKGFTQKQKGGILPPQNSPDGWYYSQRDERWAMRTISYSSETIFDVGCLISSVAMVSTFYGDRKTPLDIASNPSYFWLDTAYMNSPWPSVAGKQQTSLANMTEVDRELDANRPVIVHLNLGGDGHFVVLKKKEGDDYIMHDPWEGYDKKFRDFYSTASIDKRVVYK
ncbi:MAG TPA: C39 family peptidase [Patescibacteria group bacterium]|nr:C39 family peptidase [Patescibacteria group bacterium]